MDKKECRCGCHSNLKIFYACSGAANTGLAADQVARELAKQNIGKMGCLAGLGADLSGFIESSKAACLNIIIDGCSVGCGRKVLERLGISNFRQYRITDMGMIKGETIVTEEWIQKITDQIKQEFNKEEK